MTIGAGGPRPWQGNADGDPTIGRQFMRGWFVLAASCAALLAGGSTLLTLGGSARDARLWALKVGAVLAFQLLLLLVARRRILSGENLHKLWGTANLLTLFRGALVALLAGYLFEPLSGGAAAWLPALLFTGSVALDYVDGWWARRTDSRTRMGAFLDVEFDALGILLAVALTVQYRRLPLLFLSVGLARYLFVAAVALRRRRGRTIFELPPSYLRRRLAGFQMGVLAVLLWPVAGPPATTLAEALVGIPLLAGFVRDWLLSSGRLGPQNPRYRKLLRGLASAAYRWAPLALRGLLAALAVLALVAWLRGGQGAWLPGDSAGAGSVLAGVRIALIGLLATGWQASPVALGLLILESARVFRAGADPGGLLVVAAALLLYLLGPGPFALGCRGVGAGLRAAGSRRVGARRAGSPDGS